MEKGDICIPEKTYAKSLLLLVNSITVLAENVGYKVLPHIAWSQPAILPVVMATKLVCMLHVVMPETLHCSLFLVEHER